MFSIQGITGQTFRATLEHLIQVRDLPTLRAGDTPPAPGARQFFSLPLGGRGELRESHA